MRVVVGYQVVININEGVIACGSQVSPAVWRVVDEISVCDHNIIRMSLKGGTRRDGWRVVDIVVVVPVSRERRGRSIAPSSILL